MMKMTILLYQMNFYEAYFNFVEARRKRLLRTEIWPKSYRTTTAHLT